ncbi:Small heat shock protein IbpB [Arsenophonus endosymbiont of Aleurodicus dispersus]|uniref:Hsp20 family protein n=1 Tax=Arsenophonus endosymbiont of Aleurodicus dispersus TaxID=235559 RepID=UPI000EAEB808|nr:Hsp20 family protein [Arsenophonus endosymbiont of Aleurodicus dispersus]VAY02217.1 Small heat shock protein IbpB [Arsenophonus endosymbiont of Aleurodicus dispersus]
MAYRSLSLIPTFNNSLLNDRFTQMDNLFSRLTGEKPLSDAPAYNLLKKNDQHEFTVSVPGYARDELDVSVLNNQLTVRGKPDVEKSEETEEKEGIKWLHKGISKSEFTLSFTLEHRIIIQQANLANGLLTLHFTYDIPEQEKPQQIAIGVQNKSDSVLKHNAA